MTASDTADTTFPAGTAAPPRSRRRPWFLPFVVLGLLAAAAVFVWRTWFTVPPVPSNIVTLSGRIEGDDSVIGPKVDGKILEIRVREGDTVKAGDVIAVLDDSQIRAQADQARAAVRTATAQAQAARAQITVFQQELQQNQLQIAQSATDAQGRVRQAEADLSTAKENLAQQQAAYKMAQFNADAYTKLAAQGAVAEQQRVQMVTGAEQQAAAVAAAQQQVESAQGALTTARANLSNPSIHSAATAAVQQQIVQQQSMIASANAQVAQAQAQLAEAEANRADLIIRAPFSGTVTTRAAEPGEVVTAGTAIVTLLDLHQVYLRGFVPEGQIGKVAVGQTAHVYLDSNPSQPLDAYVLRIDPEATFTPENTYFREDRVTQVVGVKLGLRNGFGYAKPGMPADGEILVSGDAWPAGWKGFHSQ
jgi:HlyD family secretion protein